jgi:hypothetical protein
MQIATYSFWGLTGGFLETSLPRFQQRIRAASLTKAEQVWFPRWIDGYRQHCQLDAGIDLPITETLVIGFLRSLRDNRVAAWRRLQAARAIELYQEIIPDIDKIDLRSIKQKLHELASMEQAGQIPTELTQQERELVPGEWNPGKLDQREPEIIRRLRGRMRVLGQRRSTEIAYVKWVERFIRHVDDESLEKYGTGAQRCQDDRDLHARDESAGIGRDQPARSTAGKGDVMEKRCGFWQKNDRQKDVGRERRGRR